LPASVPDRLRSSQDFSRIQGKGKKLRSVHLLLIYLPGTLACSRFGLTVSRKVGNAVQRNQVKRWLREAIRAVGAPSNNVWDFVLIPRSEAKEAGFHILSSEIADLFSRIKP